MNDVQTKIAELQEKGWTLASIADELGVTVNAVEKWKAGDRYPVNSRAVLTLLEQISKKKRIPKKRRDTLRGKRMLHEGTKVRIKSGNNIGKIGTVLGSMPMSQPQHLRNGQEISMEGSTTLYLIEFENREQDMLGENALEITNDNF